jgi:SAM-dependent methyltransferase
VIIHKLIAHHLRHRDDEGFYRLQARDAIRWIEKNGVALSGNRKALDLGAGHGIFGAELLQRGCEVVFADESNYLSSELASAPFIQINLDRDDMARLGRYDLVVCSNVLEHLARPFAFIASLSKLLEPSGTFYLSWTNWLSPWGGHDFSPFHYLGARRGHLIFDKLTRRKRIHTPFETLYPTSIGRMLDALRRQPGLQVLKVAPRYYPEFSFITAIPLLREFLTWNCAVLIQQGRPAHRS